MNSPTNQNGILKWFDNHSQIGCQRLRLQVTDCTGRSARAPCDFGTEPWPSGSKACAADRGTDPKRQLALLWMRREKRRKIHRLVVKLAWVCQRLQNNQQNYGLFEDSNTIHRFIFTDNPLKITGGIVTLHQLGILSLESTSGHPGKRCRGHPSFPEERCFWGPARFGKLRLRRS